MVIIDNEKAGRPSCHSREWQGKKQPFDLAAVVTRYG
jgi:hypothetical protein